MSEYITFRRGRLIPPTSISVAPEFDRTLGSSAHVSATADLLAQDNPEGAETSSSVSNEPLKKIEPVIGADICIPRLKLLSKFYRIVKLQLLHHQSFSTGLFRSCSTSLSGSAITRGEMGHVRESIYCAIASWALGQAYRHVDCDGGRTHELEHSAVKCMRGILYCWMRQHKELEAFKLQQCPENALHTIFDVVTGDVINDYSMGRNYPHLQLDIQALYLLTLVQFTSSGLQLVWTQDEVNFIQNLVYYIERSYRVSDYGLWERGTKYNNGEPELHASSLGMVKSALEAINGFNVFGEKGTASSIIYVDLDAHNRNQSTLASLLPRESSSKNTDLSLLFLVGFPAFAINSAKLRKTTKDKVERKLKGSYGFKRYLRDGYGCEREGSTCSYYCPADLHKMKSAETDQNFDGLESQWPLGFVISHINATFAGNDEEANMYWEVLEPLLVLDDNHLEVLPKYYYVVESDFDVEKSHPNEAVREHSGEGNNGKLFLMGQALYIISRLLAEGLVTPNELDPIGFHSSKCGKSTTLLNDNSGSTLRGKSSKYSKFHQKQPRELCVQICVLAETNRLQALLNTYGILSQTPPQIAPVQICSPSELVRAYSYLGQNKHLGLSGRPARPFGALSTSKVFHVRGRTVVSYPLVFQQTDFYTAHDMAMLVDDIRDLIRFVKDSWYVSGRPLICCILRENDFGHDQKLVGELLELLASFRRGTCAGVPVRVGRLQTLIKAACSEHLDFLSGPECTYKFESSPIESVGHVQDLFTDFNLTLQHRHNFRRCSVRRLSKEAEDYSTQEILSRFIAASDSLHLQCQFLSLLLKREGMDFKTGDGTVRELLENVNHSAAAQHHWSVVRHCSGLLRKTVDSLAPSVTAILVEGRFVTIGSFGHEEKLITKTVTPSELHNMIFDCCLSVDPREACLQQEVLINCSKLVFSRPNLFKGMLKIRLGWIIQAMKEEVSKENLIEEFYALSPCEMKDLLKSVLEIDISQRSWCEQRRLDGFLNRSPFQFYDKLWYVLERCPVGIQIGQFLIPQQPTLSQMTNYDLRFAMLVEEMLFVVTNPNYRQILIELVMIVHAVFERNLELKCVEPLNLDALMYKAVEKFANEHEKLPGYPPPFNDNDEKARDQWFSLFYDVAPQVKNGTVKYMVGVLMDQLLSAELDISSTNLPCSVQ